MSYEDVAKAIGEAHDDLQRQESEKKRISIIEQEFPLPEPRDRYRYSIDKSGDVWLYQINPESKSDTRICTPFCVYATLKNMSKEASYMNRVKVWSLEGTTVFVDVSRGDFASAGASKAISVLYEAGLRIADKGQSIVSMILKSVKPHRSIHTYKQPGWIRSDASFWFLDPGGKAFGIAPDHDVELDNEYCLSKSAAQSGTFPGWKSAISILAECENAHHLTIGLLAGFAGPIIGLCGLNSCGLHLSGISSSGKSTSLKLSASIWSSPEPARNGLFKTARATTNASEHLAYQSNHSVLVIDELAHMDGQEVKNLIFSIAGERGKERMTQNASKHPTLTWKTFAYLSGEIGIKQKLALTRVSYPPGAMVRMIDIDVTGINREISPEVFDHLSKIDEHYGHAGQVFVKYLIDKGYAIDPAILVDNINARTDNLLKQFDGNVDGLRRRAFQVFAILEEAGLLAIEADILPSTFGAKDAIKWGLTQFLKSDEAEALDTNKLVIETLQANILSQWNVTIYPTGEKRAYSQPAKGWFNDHAVYIRTDQIAELCSGVLKPRQIGQILKAGEYLFSFETSIDRNTVKRVPNQGEVNAYALSRKYFGPRDDKDKADTSKDDGVPF